MESQDIKITFAQNMTHACRSVIIVPDSALCSPDTITCATVENNAHAKHHFHSIGQMALFLFEDGELDAGITRGAIEIDDNGGKTALNSGIALYIDTTDKLNLLSNSQENISKLLQANHRYCTKWVRLDL